MERGQLDALVAFARVAERRSFRAAAGDLNVSPSAVSQSVKGLEDRLGAPLLARSTRSVGLTEAGARLLDHARDPLRRLAEALEAARADAGAVAGTLRLNVPRVALPLVVEPLLDSFARAYPEVVLELFVDDGLADIARDGFDAGLRLGEVLDEDMVGVRLTEPMALAVVAAPAYLDRHGRPGHPDDLRGHACINYRNTRQGSLYRWEFEDGDREWAVGVRGAVIVNDSNLKVAAALRGLGLAYELDPVVAPLVDAGLLERVLEPYCPHTPGFFLYYPARGQVMPKLRAFIDHAKTVLEAGRSRDR